MEILKKPEHITSLATSGILIRAKVKVWTETKQAREISDEVTANKKAAWKPHWLSLLNQVKGSIPDVSSQNLGENQLPKRIVSKSGTSRIQDIDFVVE